MTQHPNDDDEGGFWWNVLVGMVMGGVGVSVMWGSIAMLRWLLSQ